MKSIISFLFLVFSINFVMAQGFISPSGNNKSLVVCPGSTVAFSFYDPNGNVSSKYKWVVVKGKVSVNNSTEYCQTGFSPVNIVWDTNLDINGKVKLYRVTDCNTAPANGTLIDSITVRKYKYTSAEAISTSTLNCSTGLPSINCGSTQNISLVFWLNNNGTEYSGQHWEVLNNSNCITTPAGWSVTSVSVTYTAANCNNSISTFQASRVTVNLRTDGIHAGDVKMRVHGTACDGNYNGFYGDWSTATLNLATISSPSFNSSNTLFFCDASTSKSVTVNSNSATSYVWTVPNGYLINNTSSTLTTTSNTVAITSPTAANGEAVLSVVAQNACSSSSASQLKMYYGTPNYFYAVQPFDSSQQFCVNSFGNTMKVEPQNQVGINYFEWGYVDLNSNGPPTVVNPAGSYIQDFSFFSPGTYEIYARQGNECGLGSTVTYIVNVEDCTGGGFGSFLISPNPANSSVTIVNQQNNSTDGNNINQKYDYVLYDKKGHHLRQGSAQSKKAQLDVSNLQNDTYYLHIKYHSKTIVKQIVVNH